ncbi:type III pantothenate kinase [Pelagibacteraceae bacterium]|nr:type III pantothenate kinase [Pelagibacteraceae bacterium]|tara:strand:+ start:269 stop:1027 length:759 start_codon:yes stop_codon:yes gene_type:complete
MKILIGDIGNTLTKLCLISEKFKIIKEYNIKTAKIIKEKNIIKFLSPILKKDIKKKVLFSSVVPSVYQKIKKFIKTRKYQSYEIKNLSLKKLIKIKIDKYNQLGSDRIANAIGAYSLYKKNCIVVDFGTATTFDIVRNPGVYEGGVIAPGIKLSILNLNRFTAALPIFELKTDLKTYGKNTKDALNAGFLWGYQGLVNNILKKIKTSFNCNFKIILTGGYSKIFFKFINNNTTIEPNITIEGIMHIYKNLIK